MHCISIYIYCISQVDSTFFRGTLTIKLLITYRFKKTKKYIRYNNNISGKGGYKQQFFDFHKETPQSILSLS